MRKTCFTICICLLFSCTKYKNGDGSPNGPIYEIPNDPPPPIEILQRTDGIYLSNNIIADVNGNVYFYDYTSKVIYSRSAISNLPGATNLGSPCFPLYDGYYTHFTIHNNTLIGIEKSNIVLRNLKSSTFPGCGSLINYGAFLEPIDFYGYGIGYHIQSDYNGGIYFLGNDYKVKYKSSTDVAFSELIGNVGLTLPKCKDFAVSSDNRGIFLVYEDGTVHLHALKSPIVSHKEYPKVDAYCITTDIVQGNLYVSDKYRVKKYESSIDSWVDIGFPYNAIDIAAYDNHIYVISHTNRVYKKDLNTPSSSWQLIF